MFEETEVLTKRTFQDDSEVTYMRVKRPRQSQGWGCHCTTSTRGVSDCYQYQLWKRVFDDARPSLVRMLRPMPLLDYLPKKGLDLPAKTLEEIRLEKNDRLKSQRLLEYIGRLAQQEESSRAYERFVEAIEEYNDTEGPRKEYDSLRDLVEREIRRSIDLLTDYPLEDVIHPTPVTSHSPLLTRSHRLYKSFWYDSSNGTLVNFQRVRTMFLENLQEAKSCSVRAKLILAIDATCTHVPIVLKIASTEEVVELLEEALSWCGKIMYDDAIVMKPRLLRRIACIHLREFKSVEARRKLEEAKMQVNLCSAPDVGKADFYWLLSWISFFEILENNKIERLETEWPTIRDAIQKAMSVACRLDNLLRKAYMSRIACNAACLYLQMAEIIEQIPDRIKLMEDREQLTPGTLRARARRFREENVTIEHMAKRDLSLALVVDKWLSRVTNDYKSEYHRDIANTVHPKGHEKSNIVFITNSKLCEELTFL